MDSQKISKIIRIVTAAPITAFIALSVLYRAIPEIFNGLLNYILGVVFLTLLPLSAYPLQPLVPGFKNEGRDGQRRLAIIMAVVGYLLGVIAALCFNAGRDLIKIYLTYLLSGLLILFFNKILKIRASGHACGAAGPVALLVYFIGTPALAGAAIISFVYYSSLKLKRHSWKELILGSIIPLIALTAANFITLMDI